MMHSRVRMSMPKRGVSLTSVSGSVLFHLPEDFLTDSHDGDSSNGFFVNK